jgi:hypothetical protein
MIKGEKNDMGKVEIWVSLTKETRDKKGKPSKNNVKPINEPM